MKKIGIYSFLVVMILAVFGYLYLNKSHINYDDKPAVLTISSVDLYQRFVEDEKLANTELVNEVIEVSGKVIEVSEEQATKYIVLESNDLFFGVNVYFDSTMNMTNLTIGKEVLVKGLCTGGDDLGVVITNAIIVN